jgi:exosortase/archaeosortase family protein
MVENLRMEPLTPKNMVVYLLTFLMIAISFQQAPSGWLEVQTAMVSSTALRVLGFRSEWGVVKSEAFLTLNGGARNVSVSIVRECTGIHVFAIFAGLVLPICGGFWRRKGASLVIAGIILFILNISRVMMTILLTGFNVPPFAWIFTNPTVETYHYPLSLVYGLVGVALLVVVISKWTLPELGYTLISIIYTIKLLYNEFRK